MTEQNIHFVSVCDDISKASYLITTASANNIRLTFFVTHAWSGFECKITALVRLLQGVRAHDIVCFVDAYDVLVLQNSNTIKERFLEYTCNILFSSEQVCFPSCNEEKYDEYYKDNVPLFPCLNSGGFIGYSGALLKMLTSKCARDIQAECYNGGDQAFFTNYFLSFHDDEQIQLDTKQLIFQSMCAIDYSTTFTCIGGRIYNKLTNVYPCILHFNGFRDNDVKCVRHRVTGIMMPALHVFLTYTQTQYTGMILYDYPYIEHIYGKTK